MSDAPPVAPHAAGRENGAQAATSSGGDATDPKGAAADPFPPTAATDLKSSGAVPGPSTKDSVADGSEGPRSAEDPELPDKVHAGQQQGNVNVSVKEVLLLRRRGSAASTAGDDAAESPLKKQNRKDGKEASPPPPPCTPLTALINRPMLGKKTPSAPPKKCVTPTTPPTPSQGSRKAAPSAKFVLRQALLAGRSMKIAELMNRWAVIQSTTPEGGVTVRVVGAREYAAVVRKQDIVSFLLSSDALALIGQKRHALFSAGQNLYAERVQDRAIVEVEIDAVTSLLPYTSMDLMAELHRINADCAIAGQSSLWLQGLGQRGTGDQLVAPEANPFLMPTRRSAEMMKTVVKQAVGGASLSDMPWQRTSPKLVREGVEVDLVSSWSLDGRAFTDAARPVWLQ